MRVNIMCTPHYDPYEEGMGLNIKHTSHEGMEDSMCTPHYHEVELKIPMW